MKDLLHIVLDFISRFFFFQKHVILPLITYETWVEILQTYSADRQPRLLVFHFFHWLLKFGCGRLNLLMARNVGICMKNCIIGSYLEERGGNADRCWVKRRTSNLWKIIRSLNTLIHGRKNKHGIYLNLPLLSKITVKSHERRSM